MTKELANELLISRRKASLTQDELAKLSGVSRNFISMIERGVAGNVSEFIIGKLYSALGKGTGDDSTRIPTALYRLLLKTTKTTCSRMLQRSKHLELDNCMDETEVPDELLLAIQTILGYNDEMQVAEYYSHEIERLVNDGKDSGI